LLTIESFIAGMGALLTIMASFTGFAAQQLLLFTDCQRTDEAATVGIMKTNLYKASGARLAPGQYDDFLPMTVAMDVGIAQPVEDYTKILSYGCISGNCTFPSSNEAAFSTLAISHWCKDVTSEIQRVRYNGTVYSQPLQNSTVSLDIDDESDPLQFDPYSYTGVLLTGVSYLQYNGTLATIKMLYRPDPTIRTEYKALSCALYPSVNTYAAEVHTSVLKERLIESVPIGLNLLVVNQSMATEPDFKLARSHTIRNGSSVNCIGLKDPASNRLGIALGNVDKAPTDWTAPDLNATDYNRMWYPEDCVWALYHPSAYDIHNHLNLTFQAQQLQANPVSVDAFAGPVALRRMYRNDQYMNLDTVNEFLHNLTRSMTAIIRTNGAENFTHPAEGTMWYTTTCVRVRWKWISYPAIMIGLSAIFLVLVSIESSGVASERLWKSSILAMLFCDMDDVVTNGEKPATKRDMEHVAKSTSFSIGGEEDRLRLVAR
jgi:hypothetical protein